MRNLPSSRSNKNSITATVIAMKDTGEAAELEVKVPIRPKYRFTGSWRAIGMYELMRVLKADLSDTDRRIAFWIPVIAKKADGPNTVMMTGKRAEAELGISKFALSRAIPKLVRLGLLRKTEVRGMFLVDPDYSFHGSVPEHNYAKNVWYKVLESRPHLPETQEVA